MDILKLDFCLDKSLSLRFAVSVENSFYSKLKRLINSFVGSGEDDFVLATYLRVFCGDNVRSRDTMLSHR